MNINHSEVECKYSRGRHLVKEQFSLNVQTSHFNMLYLFSIYGYKHIIWKKLYYADISEFDEPQILLDIIGFWCSFKKIYFYHFPDENTEAPCISNFPRPEKWM